MTKRPNLSAGLLLFRQAKNGLEVLLAHPGGPFWVRKDAGAWSIPKGLAEPGEELLATAQREFSEETGLSPSGPFIPLGDIRQKAGKIVHAWAFEGDADPSQLTSNTMTLEWPAGSGRRVEFPEIDRWSWFDLATARTKLIQAQVEFINRLERALARPPQSE